MLSKIEQGEFYLPCYLNCNFFAIDLIEVAQRTEARQNGPRIFDDVDDFSNSITPKI